MTKIPPGAATLAPPIKSPISFADMAQQGSDMIRAADALRLAADLSPIHEKSHYFREAALMWRRVGAFADFCANRCDEGGDMYEPATLEEVG